MAEAERLPMFILILSAVGLLVTLVPDAFTSVRDGYQDEFGFHFLAS